MLPTSKTDGMASTGLSYGRLGAYSSTICQIEIEQYSNIFLVSDGEWVFGVHVYYQC